VLSGDPATFSRTLKSLRYYTADEKAYTAAIVARFRQFDAQTRDNAGRDAVAGLVAVAGSLKDAFISAAEQVANAVAGDGAELIVDRDAKPPNVFLSHGWRCSVAELVADARKAGRFHSTFSSAAPPLKVGDLIIGKRAGQNPINGGSGHVERVTSVEPNPGGMSHVVTIGGNESNTWIEAPLDWTSVVGVIDVDPAIGRRAVELSRAELAAGVAEVPGPAAHPRIQAYHAGARRGGSDLAGMPGHETEGIAVLGSKASDEIHWCASSASWAAYAATSG
jgi:hypothetical protein